MKSFIIILVFLLIFNFGCSSNIDNITKEQIANICEINEDDIIVIKGKNYLEFKIQISDLASQSLVIEKSKNSKTHFENIKKIQQKNNLIEYPNLGSGSIIWSTPISRIMLVVDGNKIYRISSIISGCNNDEKLIEIVNLFI
jgi:hypothetical protein